MNLVIKEFHQKIRIAESEQEQKTLISRLRSYIDTMLLYDQIDYRDNAIANIKNKFDLMDKLIESMNQ